MSDTSPEDYRETGGNTSKSSLTGAAEGSLHPEEGNANLFHTGWMFRLVLDTLEAEAGNY